MTSVHRMYEHARGILNITYKLELGRNNTLTSSQLNSRILMDIQKYSIQFNIKVTIKMQHNVSF